MDEWSGEPCTQLVMDLSHSWYNSFAPDRFWFVDSHHSDECHDHSSYTITGVVMTLITMMAVYEPKSVRSKRKERMKGRCYLCAL